MIGTSSSIFLISSAIVKPSLFGSITSSTQISGSAFLNAGVALAPSLSMITSKPRLSRLSFTILPRNNSSSTYKTFVLLIVVYCKPCHRYQSNILNEILWKRCHSWLAFSFRQSNNKFRTQAGLTFHFDFSVMSPHNMRHIAQPEPVTFCIMCISQRYTEKFFKHFLLVFW